MTGYIPKNFTPELLSDLFQYDPHTGGLVRLRTMQPVGVQLKGSQAYIEISGRRVNARKVVVALMTGRWPNAHEYRFIGGDKRNLEWSNFLRIKDGEQRRCNNCGQMKHQSQFHKSGRGSKSFTPHCIPCHATRQTKYARTTALRKYGLTPACYAKMLEEQGDACAICGRDSFSEGKHLAVDHCHDSGVVRGLLCGPCNQALGMLGDNPAMLLKAAKYLLKHKP